MNEKGKTFFRHFFRIIILIISAQAFTSCEKNHLSDLFMSNGKEINESRDVTGNFTKIRLEDGVDLVISTGKPYQLTLTGGENVIEGVETFVSDSCLTISNKNRFNWVRSYDKKITAHVTLPHLIYLEYVSSCNVSNTDTIVEDSLFITAYGSGYINLLLNTRSSHLALTRGSVDFNIKGNSAVNYLFADGYGPFHCEELKTGFTFMRTLSTNDCYVYVTEDLEYEINNLGNVYYKGNPKVIHGIANSDGRLIKLE